jgi:hypothetical protein
MNAKKIVTIFTYCFLFMACYSFHYSNSFASTTKAVSIMCKTSEVVTPTKPSLFDDIRCIKQRERSGLFKLLSSSRSK